MIVKPFRGLRPRSDLASRIPSYPYDVLDSNEARALAAGDPYTFLHVVKSEIDLDPSIDVHDERVYAKARENFLAMREKGWLVRDPAPAYYVYRLTMGQHVQTGVVGVCAADDYREGRIKRHEHTRPEKENDRTRHAEALSANPGPVFLAYRGHEGLESVTRVIAKRQPDAAFTPRTRLLAVAGYALVAGLVVGQTALAWSNAIATSRAQGRQFAEIARWVQANMPPGEPVITTQANTLNYATGHPALTLPTVQDVSVLRQLADRYGVRFVIITERNGLYPLALDDPAARARLIEHLPQTFIYELER